MADKWSQYEEKPTRGPQKDKWAEYEDKATKEEPGWFMPGSKSETVARTLSQAGTFGFGDEIQAALRAAPTIFDPKEKFAKVYQSLRDEERAANVASAETNPKTALASNLAGALIPGAGVVKAGRAAYAVPTMLAPATNAAIAAGAAGTAQGALSGAGRAESIADIPRGVAQEATLQGTLGSVAPGIDSVMGRFVQNYKGLRPAVTANIGPMTIGGGAGALGGASGVLPSFNGRFVDPTMTRQETWSSDPYSKIADTVGWGLTGAALGKGVKTIAQAGGAAQKTLAGEGQAGRGVGGAYNKPLSQVNEPPVQGGGGMGGTEPPPMPTPDVPPTGPKAPPGMDPKQAQKQAMGDTASPEGRAKTNTTSPVFEEQSDKVVEARKQFQTVWDKVQPEQPPVNVVRPGEEPVDASARVLREMPPSTAPLPKPPPSDMADDNPMKPLLMQWKQSMDQKKTPMGMVDEGSVSDDIWEQYQKKIGTKTVDDAFTEFNNAYNAGKNREAFHEIPQKYGFVDDDAMMEAWRASPSGKLYDENRTTLNNIGSIGRAFILDPNEISSIADLTRQKGIIADLKSLPRSSLDNLNDEYHRLVSEGISTHVQPDPHAMLKAALGKP